MKIDMSHRIIKMIALAIAVILAASPAVNAEALDSVQPRASDYLDSYQSYIYPAGSGKIQVWFSVTADDYMDQVGALRIFIYESTDNINWTYVETFSHAENTNMLVDDDYFHMDHVTYQGVAGRYYKAYVCIWAGKDGGGDTRYFWTSAKLAT